MSFLTQTLRSDGASRLFGLWLTTSAGSVQVPFLMWSPLRCSGSRPGPPPSWSPAPSTGSPTSPSASSSPSWRSVKQCLPNPSIKRKKGLSVFWFFLQCKRQENSSHILMGMIYSKLSVIVGNVCSNVYCVSQDLLTKF